MNSTRKVVWCTTTLKYKKYCLLLFWSLVVTIGFFVNGRVFCELPRNKEVVIEVANEKIRGVYLFVMIRETRQERIDQLLVLLKQLLTMTPNIYPSVIFTHDLDRCNSWKVPGMDITCILDTDNFDFVPRLQHFPEIFKLPSAPSHPGFDIHYRQMLRFAGGFLFSNRYIKQNFDYAIKLDSDLRITARWERDPFEEMTKKRAKMGYWMAYNDIIDVSVGLDGFFKEYARSHSKPLSDKLFVGKPIVYNNKDFYGCVIGVDLEFINSDDYLELFKKYDETNGWYTGRWDEQKLFAFYGTHWATSKELMCFDFIKVEHQALTNSICL